MKKVLITLVTLTTLSSCNRTQENIKIVEGDKYIIGGKLDDADPYEIAKYDTVVVLGKKEGYIKYTSFKNLLNKDTTRYVSTSEEYFISSIKKDSL